MQFRPTQWETAKDKEKFANHFMKFVKGDFQEKHFTKKFYTRLSMTFGHIAHYNKNGFYDHFFDSTEGKVAFLKKCINHHCVGDPQWTYSDVEKVLRTWLITEGFLERYQNQSEEELDAGERRLYERLKAKFEGDANG